MRITCALLTWVGLLTLTTGASQDNNVEYQGVSHIDWLDRRPLCPIDGEAFSVMVQTYHYDVTAVNVIYEDGAAQVIPATFSHNKGIYDVWTADLPVTASTSISYYFQLIDGSDTDYLGPFGMSSSPPTSKWVNDYVNYSHAPLGATPLSNGGTFFRVWAPNAVVANVAGTFNSWNSANRPLNNDGDYWWRKVGSAPTGSKFKFVFNGDVWKPDPRSRYHDAGDNYNSVAIDPLAYEFQSTDYSMPPWEELVIYELHVGTFAGNGDGLGRQGDYRDVVDVHLDHLLDLGVNCVELMPICENFSPFTSWGYSPINVWATEYDYGSVEDLKYLIDKLHANGIAVLQDIVWNHQGSSDNFLWYYDETQVYFDDPAVGTPWGDQMDFDRPEVRDYLVDSAIMWLDEFNFDGFRMDATRYMRDNSIFTGGQSAGWQLMQDFNNAIDNRKINAISIAEELPNDTAITTSTGSGGAGFDAQWCDYYIDTMRQEAIDAAFGDPEITKIRDAFFASGYYPYSKVIRYIESHDEAGNGERLPVELDNSDPQGYWAKSRAKLIQGMTFFVPGIPMFLMGSEWNEDIKFDSGPYNSIDWTKASSNANFLQFFKDAIAVRRSNCGFRSDAGSNVYAVSSQYESDNLFIFARGDGNELLVIANFGNTNWTNYAINFPQGGTWYEILNSQASVYGGNGQGNGGVVTTSGGGNTAYLTIPQAGLLVFRHEDAVGRDADVDFDGDKDVLDYSVLQLWRGASGCGMSLDIRENGRIDARDLDELEANMSGPN